MAVAQVTQVQVAKDRAAHRADFISCMLPFWPTSRESQEPTHLSHMNQESGARARVSTKSTCHACCLSSFSVSRTLAKKEPLS